MGLLAGSDAAQPPRRKVALVTGASCCVRRGARRVLTAPAGVNGQDGSYLVELLLTKGYDVVGAQRAPQLARARRASCKLRSSNNSNGRRRTARAPRAPAPCRRLGSRCQGGLRARRGSAGGLRACSAAQLC